MRLPNLVRPAAPFRIDLILPLCLLMVGCGGSGDSDGPPVISTEGPNSGGGRAWISSPSQMGTYQTDRTSARLQGGCFTPPGSTCPGPVGVLPPGFTVTWTNALTGGSGGAIPSLNCLVYTIAAWDTVIGVPLDVGANTIQVTVDDGAGNVGRDKIVVTRMPDTTPPTVTWSSPVDGASGVSRYTTVQVQFSEVMDSTSINATTLILADGAGVQVPSAVSYDAQLLRATLAPTLPLGPSTSYRFTVTPGVRDYPGGNPLRDPYVVAFSTGP